MNEWMEGWMRIWVCVCRHFFWVVSILFSLSLYSLFVYSICACFLVFVHESMYICMKILYLRTCVLSSLPYSSLSFIS